MVVTLALTRVEKHGLFEHWQYVKCQKFQLKLNIRQWTAAILSNVNTDATLFPMSNGFMSTGAPRGAGSPHRNRSSAVRERGNVIRPTRCTDQGTSYCFTNLLLPHSLFFFFLVWGGLRVCVCVWRGSYPWASSEIWDFFATNKPIVVITRPGHLSPLQSAHTQTHLRSK